MDPKRYFLRPFEDADYDALARLESALSPEFPVAPKDERQWDHVLEVEHMVHEKWVIQERESGQVVAVAALNHQPHSYDPHKFWTGVIVDPEHAHRGIGRALASFLDSEATAHRATCFWTSVRKDDERGLRFSEKQGFTELRTVWMSVLDVTSSEPTVLEDRTAALEKDGIRLTTLAEEGTNRPEVHQRIHDLWTEAGRDVPRMGPYTPTSIAEVTEELDSPHTIPEAFFIARHGEAYVGATNLTRDFTQPDSLVVSFTGTRAAYRGKGLATELKRRAVEYARRQGIRYLRTFNDSLNHPIWAINQKLGFRRTVEWSQQERRFGPDPGTPAVGPHPGAGTAVAASRDESVAR